MPMNADTQLAAEALRKNDGQDYFMGVAQPCKHGRPEGVICSQCKGDFSSSELAARLRDGHAIIIPTALLMAYEALEATALNGYESSATTRALEAIQAAKKQVVP